MAKQATTDLDANTVRSITVDIDAPASVVWEILTDLPNYNTWNPHCIRIDSTLCLGDPVNMTLVSYTNPGELNKQVEYLCAFEPERLLSWEIPAHEDTLYPARRDQVIEPLGESRCRYYSTDAFPGANGGHVMFLAGPWVKRAFDDVARALKARAESLHQERLAHGARTPAGPSPEHMRDTMLSYAELLSAGNVDGIVALFAPNAVLEDPVGSTPVRGLDGLRAFYQSGQEQTGGTLRMRPEGAVRVAGNEAACAMIVDCSMGGERFQVETLDTLVFDDQGRILSLRAHVGPLNFHRQPQ